MKRVLFLIIAVAFLYGISVYREAHMHPKIPVLTEHSAPIDEKEIVRNYFSDSDLTALTGEPPILGGTWYITEIEVNTTTDQVMLSIEDGHIQIKGTAFYSFDQTSRTVTVKSFTRE